MAADITLVNLNMLFMRYGEEIERELHVPLGPLYLTRALEDAGVKVDFRDYQCVPSGDPFDRDVFLEFLKDPGSECIENRARKILKTWRFEPATLHGKPVSVFYNLTANVHFR